MKCGRPSNAWCCASSATRRWSVTSGGTSWRRPPSDRGARIGLTRRLRLLAYLLRYFGIGWLIHRVRFAAERRLGVHVLRERLLDRSAADLLPALGDGRFATAAAYAAYRRAAAPPFFIRPADRDAYRPLLNAWDASTTAVAGKVSQIERGSFTYFDHTREAGCPPDWHRNPFTGVAAPDRSHWSRIDERAFGDIKVIWELSRFAWAYSLVRQYWRTGDEATAELFWTLLEDWDRANPPGVGVNWRCSQEIAIRVMACSFALHALLDARATTPGRVLLMARLMWASGHRIALDLDDALSQHNNHGITAAAGLFTIGVLFPEFRESPAWVTTGQQTLERLGRTLIYDDGSFVQHSLNYQRLMLHDYIWVLALSDRAGRTFSTPLRERVRRSAELLRRLQDESTGFVPQYGHSDGALILPLDGCDYRDFRPVTQAAGVLLDGRRWWPEGPWDEGVLWLFGPAALASAVQPPAAAPVAAPVGGYYTLRGADTFVMTRCATFRHRPGQADLLHVDAWWRGHNVAIDAGTFSYSEGGDPAQALAGTAAHNTVTVDGADQMERFGRFLWFPWITGRVQRSLAPSGDIEYWEGEHDGYRRRGVRHRRRIVRLGPSAWLIIDRLAGNRPHGYRLHWLLPDGPHVWDHARLAVTLRLGAGDYKIQVAADGVAAGDLVRASADGRGWRSAYYYSREPALSLAINTTAASAVFVTLLAPAPAAVRIASGHVIEVTADDRIYRLTADGAITQ